ncbi:kinase-like domain-containing protein [Hypoxylon crocopeplum]|nr:kinase-like domain-containing protein [Hypoxylon crocopeplum]
MRRGGFDTAKVQDKVTVLMSINHPHILNLKDAFDERNAIYLFMDLVPEYDLLGHIHRKQKLSEDETKKLCVQLFGSVKCLHDRKIIHRDIKTENILLMDEDLHVKLSDFYLAMSISHGGFATELHGTMSFTAPEMLPDNQNRRYTKAVDIQCGSKSLCALTPYLS